MAWRLYNSDEPFCHSERVSPEGGGEKSPVIKYHLDTVRGKTTHGLPDITCERMWHTELADRYHEDRASTRRLKSNKQADRAISERR